MTRLQLTGVLIFSLLIMLSFSSNPPQGRTGAPGERTCASAGCHLNQSASIRGKLELRGLPETFTSGVDYTLAFDMIVESGAPVRGGLQVSALTVSEEDAQAFINPSMSSTVSTTGGRSYFEHDPAKRFEGSDTITYEVNWNYQGDSAEDIIFYAAANFANGNNAQSGDRIVTWSDTFSVASTSDFVVETEVSNPTCIGGDGSIFLDVSGGTPPYRYEWFTDLFILSSDSTNSYSGLPTGSYIYSVIDSNNETINGEVILIEDDTTPPVMTCLVDTLTISNCTPLSYPIPTAEDDCSPVSIRLAEGLGSNQSFPAGISLEIYEASDTSANIALCTIVVNNVIDIVATVDVQNIACFDDSIGSVMVMASGGEEPYTSISTEGLSIDMLPEGQHTIVTTDATGCQILSDIEVRRPQPLSVEVEEVLNPISTTSGDGVINIDVDGGTPPYTYQWRTEDEDFSNDEDLSLLFPGVYHVIVTDSRGCQIVSDSITVDALTFVADIEVSEAIKIYPNPTIDQLSLDMGQMGATAWSIQDISGRVIYHSKEIKTAIDVSGLDAGVYILAVQTTSGQRGIKTFVKY